MVRIRLWPRHASCFWKRMTSRQRAAVPRSGNRPRRVRCGLALALALAVVPAFAADAPAKETRDAPTASGSSGKKSAKTPRLRFRTADGTCACTCASGGMSEADIRKAQEARERAAQ